MIDTHAHLDFPQFDQDRDEVIQRAFSNGIKKIINVGCNLERAKAAVDLAEKYENIYTAVGIHPSDIASFCHPEERSDDRVPPKALAVAQGSLRHSETKKPAQNAAHNKAGRQRNKEIEEIKIIVQHSKVVAIGEIGLDYFHIAGDNCNAEALQCSASTLEELKNNQREFFIAQLKLARELDLPVIIHCRPADNNDAYEDLLKICSDRSRPVAATRGVIHCFSSNRQQAQKFLDLGFYISFTGNITYDKRGDSELTKVVREIPLEKILLETDCPFLASAPMRGKRNEPLFVKYVAEKIAEIKKIDIREVENITDRNAERLFGI